MTCCAEIRKRFLEWIWTEDDTDRPDAQEIADRLNNRLITIHCCYNGQPEDFPPQEDPSHRVRFEMKKPEKNFLIDDWPCKSTIFRFVITGFRKLSLLVR